MKVLHIQKVTGIAGSERHLLSLLPALAATGVEPHVLVLGDAAAAGFESALDDLDLPHTRVELEGHVSLAALRRVLGVFRSVEPDLVHTHLIHGDLYGQTAARLTGTPALSTFHSTNPFFARAEFRALERVALSNTSVVIAISHHVARFLSDLGLVDPSRVEVVHYGIDLARWDGLEARRADFRGGFGVRPEEFMVGCASRLFPSKGHELFLHAFDRAAGRAPSLKACVAGSGPLREELEALALSLEHASRIRFMGHVEHIERFLAACDALVFPTQPSFGEGFGLAALEAMAAGTAVIASNVDSLPEVIADGSNGVLVAPGDVEAMADALVTLSSDRDRTRAMGAAGRTRVRTAFTLERMVMRTFGLYSKVVR